MNKYPIVYAQRPIMQYNRTMCQTVCYVVSKAYLKKVTTTFLKDGKNVKTFEVQFLGYEDVLKDLNQTNKYFLAVSNNYNVENIFSDACSCKAHTVLLNKKLFEKQNLCDGQIFAYNKMISNIEKIYLNSLSKN